MKEPVYIHVGFHKSASTWLQRRCFPHTGLNFLYLSARSRRLMEWIEGTGSFEPEAYRDAVWAEARTMPGFVEGRGLILSHEELSGHPHGDPCIDRKRVADRLRESFPGARILIVIRNPVDYALSIYTFRVAVKGFESRPFRKFLREEGANGLYSHLDYRSFIGMYREWFGKESVTVVPMEWLRADAERFRTRVSGFLDGTRIGDGVNLKEGVNVSTRNRWILGFWRPLNRIFELVLNTLIRVTGRGHEPYPFEGFRFFYYRVKTQVTRRLNAIVGSSGEIRVHPEDLEVATAHWVESTEWIEREETIDLKALGYPER